ncbi:phosphoserine phosphatase SerB [Roseomonas marmotae]|uniref:Phosphoserine phosphatase n=1 Tax=Roseomonas marmotae TaxID=2768161 RepID=A0ABS3KIT5_9PROT|nr:phosphoserine phosphatase SerB [Roseomonas marmotae]MBO1076251.1 phosphoserine phosphatase SerB [Roseomonas marmotae]QTI77866.1 phosphoserine phosphatase SerB [Roseomonas marmotae]
MSHILTLIAPPGILQAPLVARLRTALLDLGGQVGTPDWLAEAEAVDLPFSLLAPEQASAIARAALDGAPVDCIALPAEGRRKKLLVADMDSTIVTAETLDELAAYAGVQDKIAAITQRSMNGEIDFATSLRERVAMIRGLALTALEETWAKIELMPGAEVLVRTMAGHGAHCAIASGGFTWFTARVAEKVGFQSHHANILLDDGKALTGLVREPVFDRDAKLTILKTLAAELGLPLSATAAVGDGANDLAMLGAAGLGVAFRAKPVVASSARARIDHADLRALLYAQGYRKAEFLG